MTDENHGLTGDQAGAISENREVANSKVSADSERLHERINQLEQERERDRRALAALEAERDAYRRVVYAWALGQVTDEEVERYAQTEEGASLDDFIAELERPAHADRDG
jgi:hypothetical protein